MPAGAGHGIALLLKPEQPVTAVAEVVSSGGSAPVSTLDWPISFAFSAVSPRDP
jgi:hypothetical protein